MIVQKYGGTSVGNPERILSVSERIQKVHQSGESLIVVVSAMGDTTDELIKMANQISFSPSHREMDMLLSSGERISMALLAMALTEKGISCVSFTGSQVGMITDDRHRRARIKRVLGERVKQALSEDKVVIVAGFQGVSESKEITTLGRGGSDTTAVALAASFKAKECQIYTDVDGVYSADPHVVSSARLWEKLSYELMIELAHHGAQVLHPRSVELAKQFQVPLVVLNSLKPGIQKGTRIEGDDQVEELTVSGVSADFSKSLISIELSRSSVSGAIWDMARDGHFTLLSPFIASQGGQTWMTFFTDTEMLPEWKKKLDRLSVDGFIRGFKQDSDWVPVSVVGGRLTQDGEALSRLTEALAREQIWVTMGAASSLAITVAVERQKANDAVRVLHEAFKENLRAS